MAEGRPSEIFYDDKLLDSTGLKKPQIVQIYQKYCLTKGMKMDQRPVNMDELAECF